MTVSSLRGVYIYTKYDTRSNIYIAAGILSEIGTINRFCNNLKFASYTGLIPSEHSSGEKR